MVYLYNKSPVESPSVTTYPSVDGEASSQRSVFQNQKGVGVATNLYSSKTLEKPKRGLRILKGRVWELFTQGEGISTPRTHHKGRQPLVECAKMWLQNYVFSIFIFFIFLGLTRVLHLLLCIFRCDEEFKPT